MTNPKLRAIFLFILTLAFGVLIFGGYIINKEKPPIPVKITAPTGNTIITGADIIDGQNYYFSRGGQHIGTIWGHGSYLAPDWSADFLHRTGLYLAARHHGLSSAEARNFTQTDFEVLDSQEQARLSVLVQEEIKTNRFNPESGVLKLTQFQAEVFEALTDYYTTLFQDGNERMGLQPGMVDVYQKASGHRVCRESLKEQEAE